MPVASLWASLDYKSVANWPIQVSRILYLTILISEIKNEIHLSRVVFIGQRYFLRLYKICKQGWSLPKCSPLPYSTTMVGSQPCPKILVRVEVTESGKHSSLLQCSKKCCHKKIYCTYRSRTYVLHFFFSCNFVWF